MAEKEITSGLRAPPFDFSLPNLPNYPATFSGLELTGFPVSNERASYCFLPPNKSPTVKEKIRRIVQMWQDGASGDEIIAQQAKDTKDEELHDEKALVEAFNKRYGQIPAPTINCDHITNNCNTCDHIHKKNIPKSTRETCLEAALGVTDYKGPSYTQNPNSEDYLNSLYPLRKEKMEKISMRLKATRKHREQIEKRGEAKERAKSKNEQVKGRAGFKNTTREGAEKSGAESLKSLNTLRRSTRSVTRERSASAYIESDTEMVDEYVEGYSNAKRKAKTGQTNGDFERENTANTNHAGKTNAKAGKTNANDGKTNARAEKMGGNNTKGRKKARIEDELPPHLIMFEAYIPKLKTRSQGRAELAGGLNDDIASFKK
ncbi:hypothetical protein RUND412_011546 [Rhizina undulata]